MTTAYEEPHTGQSVLDGLTEEPWRDVPAEEARWMRPHLPDLLGPMVQGVLRHVPEYDRPGHSAYSRVAEAAVAHAMEHFVRMIADPDASWTEVYQVFFDVGYGEAVEGRGLEHLQNAMRVGSRLAWRHLAVEAERLGRPHALISLLAEANFAYLDVLASAAAHGYSRAREKAAGEREQRRGRLPPSLLSGLDHGRPCLIVPDPDGPGRSQVGGRFPAPPGTARYEELTATLAGCTGAIGPSVPVDQAGTSLLWARRVHPQTVRYRLAQLHDMFGFDIEDPAIGWR